MARNVYLSWDSYFMLVAMASAQRSKDPSTKVGACLVSKDHKILSVGYNGMPRGCDDGEMPWGRDGAWLETKYPYVCHAEENAIYNNAGASLEGATCYVTLFPCNECAKAIIQCGIKEIVYAEDKYADTEGVIASKFMLEKAGVTCRQYETTGHTVSFNL